MQQAAEGTQTPTRPATCRYAKGWFRRAEALQAMGRLSEAVAAAERAAELEDGGQAGGASRLLAGLRAHSSASGSGGDGGGADAAVRRSC